MNFIVLIVMIFLLCSPLISKEALYKSNLPWCETKNNEIISKKACYGKIVYTSGIVYEGEFRRYNGSLRYHGKGIHILSNGQTYIGNWYRGEKNGEGMQISSKGEVAIGEWKNNNLIKEIKNIEFTNIKKGETKGLRNQAKKYGCNFTNDQEVNKCIKKKKKHQRNYLNALLAQATKNHQGSSHNQQKPSSNKSKEKSFDEKWGAINNEYKSGFQNFIDEYGFKYIQTW